MKRSTKHNSENDGLSQADIDKALESLYQNLGIAGKVEPSSKVEDDGKYLTFQTKPFPESPINQIREGKPIKIKTVFHAIELSIEDQFGGTFTCEYYMRKTANHIADGLSELYPKYSKVELERAAKENGHTFEETKAAMAYYIAKQIFEIRGSVARFFHEQLEPTLKVVLSDLIVDAELCGLAKYGYKLVNASEYDKTQKAYNQMRRQRVTVIKGKGRPAGTLSIDEAIFNKFLEDSIAILSELESSCKRTTKHALARKLYPQNSNPLQQLNRFLKRYKITFEQLIQEFETQKAQQ